MKLKTEMSKTFIFLVIKMSLISAFFVSAVSAQQNQCSQIFSNPTHEYLIRRYKEIRPSDDTIGVLRNYSKFPSYVGNRLNPRDGWFQVGNFLIPNQFYNYTNRTFQMGEEVLIKDFQPFIEIASRTLHFSGGSAAIRNFLIDTIPKGEKIGLTRLMGNWEKKIWINSKAFLKNPNQETLHNLIASDIKEAKPFAENFINSNITNKDAEQIVEKALNVLGQEQHLGRIFFAPTSEIMEQYKTNDRLDFQIDPNHLLPEWFYGVEPTYIEILVPKNSSRLYLLDGLVEK